MEGSVTTENDLLIEVRDLTKHFGPIRAVDGISFTVRRGEILGFLGPNGAGKSTAMKMITCFLEPDSGSVKVAGHDIATSSLAVREKIGYLPENAPAHGEMTVSGFLEFIAEARQIVSPSAALARVVAMTGLKSVLHQSIETLSKGFKRRVGLAQALIHDPEVLILDEPTDGLDPNQKKMIQDLIASLSANKAIVLSTHILDEAEKICDRALIISQGKIVVDSTPGELVATGPGHNTIRCEIDGADPELIARIEGEPWCDRVERPDENTLEVVPGDGRNHLSELNAIVDGSQIRSVRLLEGRLEEVFRNMTQGVCA